MNFTIWKYDNGYQTDVIPIVYLHSFRGNGEDVWNACHGLNDCPPMVLVSVNNPGTGLDDELSPWPAEGVWKGQAPYKGLAAEHLRWMMEECVPQVEAEVSRFIRDTQGGQANLRWMMEECVPQVEAEVSRFIRDTQGGQAKAHERCGRYHGPFPAGHRRLLPRRPLRPMGRLELRVFPQDGKCLRLAMVSRFYGFHKEQCP